MRSTVTPCVPCGMEGNDFMERRRVVEGINALAVRKVSEIDAPVAMLGHDHLEVMVADF
ncbi:hypothetical protein LX15_003491 [Streptoalloteichus tenebrarius]|uniref:Uncharacterized protein n=1 Tax=Streptoalloteichus tenebrarius (strain ATCC 17920 / DSM 40477 / JCM 4838 / CBS 697.72 / NBRC 16177 / NCIMB 11028 / NRRL B-12390 / A12253. 1 / ISP 5477) TaxID=1933 RepID=A0ABT1HW81_STRSD|nr:hypothetical protein [Streptoalloteichus tenebrarius]